MVRICGDIIILNKLLELYIIKLKLYSLHLDIIIFYEQTQEQTQK